MAGIWGVGGSPSERVRAVLIGQVALEDEYASIQTVCSHDIYKGARAILKLPKDNRKAALEKVPPLIRPHLESEIIRLWKKDRESLIL